MEPKMKQKDFKPKVKDKVASVPKEAGRMLMKEYKEAAYRAPNTRPEQEGVRDVEQGMNNAGKAAYNTTKQGIQRGRNKQKTNYQRTKVRREHVKEKVEKDKKKASDTSLSKEKSANPKTKENYKKSGYQASKKLKNRPMGSKTDKSSIRKQMQKKAKQKKAAQQRKVMVQKAVKTAKAVATKVAAVVKGAFAAIGKGIAALVAACGPVVIIVMVVALVAAILVSAFGIFFSNENNDPGTTKIQQVASSVSVEFSKKITEVVAANPTDEVEVKNENNGYLRGDNWIDVLVVFSVKTTTSDDGMDVLTIDESRVAAIKDIFWEMNEITHTIETTTFETAVLDEDGNPTGETEETEHTKLIVTVKRMSALGYAEKHGFSNKQIELINDMMSGEYDDMFKNLLGSISYTGDGTGVVGSGNFIWPSATSDIVTSPFGERVHPISFEWSFHLGIDISAGENSEVLAADAGTVVTAGWHDSYGNYIDIDHGNGFMTRYGHNNTLLVAVGDTVQQGDMIALVGSTGNSTGPHIHFEVLENGQRLDPLQYYSNYSTA